MSGPFDDVEAFGHMPLQVHYENNSPFITFLNLVRDIEISHRGNIAVEERVGASHCCAACLLACLLACLHVTMLCLFFA